MPPTPPGNEAEVVALHEAARHRYLNYALSVITARALPDVRDGMKPVQRRILYAMYSNLRLLPDARYRKSAAVVGEVMAKLHPHGDSSIYDAMVRLAQPFTMRAPLVDGQGNFGSMDGDPAAAMRYTEARLQPIATELLSEIGQRTVDFRPNYDGQFTEPIVLPAQFPQLLVNGAEGIAVGMATRIPPHNLREVIDACIELIDDPSADVARLCRKVKGPDFPTGGVILNSRAELQDIYETGSGTVRLRGRWELEKVGRKWVIVVTEIPYSVNKATLVEKIAEHIIARKLPQIVDVRDESTADVRVVLELRPPRDGDDSAKADAAAGLAYLFKHTPLQTTWPVNLTCLIPTENPEVGAPARLDLREILRYWLDFRFATVRRRFEYELLKLRERIHILLGFAAIFDALDEAIRIIRGAEGKRDAAEKLMLRFDLDDVQVEAILELRLYKLAKLEIQAIREELEDKRRRAAEIEALLASQSDLWGVVRTELGELRKLYGDKRRTDIGLEEEEQVAYREDAYIVAEDTFLIVTRDGWIKRQGSFTEIEKIRVREGDAVAWLALCSTRATVSFFTSHGSAYVIRVDDVPSTTGYGGPVQAHFNFGDGERVVGVAVHDPRCLPIVPVDIAAAALAAVDPAGPWGAAVSRLGRVCRFPLDAHVEPSTRSGRRYMRVDDADDGVLAAWACDGSEWASIATVEGRVLCFPIAEANVLKGVGKGVTAIKLVDKDRVCAFELSRDRMEGPVVTTPQGREEVVRPNKFAGPRASKGKVVLKRGRFSGWAAPLQRLDQRALPPSAEPVEDDPTDDPTPQAGLPLKRRGDD